MQQHAAAHGAIEPRRRRLVRARTRRALREPVAALGLGDDAEQRAVHAHGFLAQGHQRSGVAALQLVLDLAHALGTLAGRDPAEIERDLDLRAGERDQRSAPRDAHAVDRQQVRTGGIAVVERRLQQGAGLRVAVQGRIDARTLLAGPSARSWNVVLLALDRARARGFQRLLPRATRLAQTQRDSVAREAAIARVEVARVQGRAVRYRQAAQRRVDHRRPLGRDQQLDLGLRRHGADDLSTSGPGPSVQAGRAGPARCAAVPADRAAPPSARARPPRRRCA